MLSECNYLLEANKLTYEDLLTFLRRRERAYISFLEFCIDKCVFNKAVLLEILQHQELNKTLFADSLRAISGDSFTDDLIKVYYSQIPSIFKFIEYSDHLEIKINLVQSHEKVGSQDYFKSQNPAEMPSEAGSLEMDSRERVSLGPQVEVVENLWIFPELDNEDLDPGLIEEFLQSFDDDKKTEMESTIMSLKNKDGDALISAMSLLYRDFHSIKGSSRFAKLKVFEKLAHELEELISVAQNIYAKLDIESRDLIEEALLLSMDVLGSLKLVVSEYFSEIPIAEDQEWLAKVERMVKCLRQASVKAFEALQEQTSEDLLSKF